MTLRPILRRVIDVLRGHTSPHEVAFSFAVGTFIGIMPGMGTPSALVAAFLFRLNKPAAALGSLISNPFTVGFFYAGGIALGHKILQVEHTIQWRNIWSFQPGWWNELVRAIPPFLVGLVPLALLIAIVSYGIVRWATQWFQQRRRQRRDRSRLSSKS